VKDFISHIIKTLVDCPEEVVVSEVNGEQCNMIEVTVAKQDVGKVIGRQGRTVDAIRVLLHCASMKDRRKYILQISDG